MYVHPTFRPTSLREARLAVRDEGVRVTSAVGHADTAVVVGSLLGIDVPCQRRNVTLRKGCVLLVAQVVGGRLPEGATELPEGVKIEFWEVWL